MDLFKISNNDKATAYDLYDTRVKYSATEKTKDKKMLRKLSRARIKMKTLKEVVKCQE